MTEQQDRGFEPAKQATWQWRFSDTADVVLDRPAPSFASQEAAEAWLTENFAELAEDGVAAVSLFDGESAIYGPMSLGPDDLAGY